MADRDEPATEPFMRALARRLRGSGHDAVDAEGNINWAVFARDLPTIHYETLRKIRVGDRALDMPVIEEIAKAAGVAPDYFAEYRLMQARQLFDPREVGFDKAIENLQEWFSGRGSAEQTARRRRQA